MGLEVDEAVDDLHAGALEVARPADVGLLVEARLELDQRRHRLAGFGGRDQLLDDRRIGRGAVECLLDRHHGRIARRLVQELHHDVEALVGMVDDDVLGADGGEAIAAEVADALGEASIVGRELEVGPVVDDHRLDVADVEHAVEMEDVHGRRLRRDLELVEQEIAQLGRHGAVDRDRDQVAAAAALERALVEQHQVLGLFVDLDVAVADQPEHRLLDHLVAREQARQVDVDQILERQEADRSTRQADETVDLRRQGQQRHQRPAIVAALQLQDRREAAVGNERKRMRRIDGERRQDREDLVDEILVEPRTLGLGELARLDDGDTGLAQLVLQVGPHLLLVGHQDRGALADRHQLVGRRHAVVAQQGRPGLQHVDQAGHADHVELVEDAGGDRQEAHALEQRMALVAGLLEHAHVEGQPRQFAIDEALRTVGCYFERRSRAGGLSEGVHCQPLLGCLPGLFTATVTPLHDGVMAIQ